MAQETRETRDRHTSARRASPQQADHWRARALRGDALRELRDSQREWVWRSLLKGVRRAIALELAGMTNEEAEPALERVRRRYEQRLAEYERQPPHQQPQRHAQQHSQPSSKAPAQSSRRRRWWPFGTQR